MPPVTLKQIAESLNVSTMTVSRALRGVGHTAAPLMARIRAQAAAMGYQSNPLARTLREARGPRRLSGLNLGLVLFSVKHQYLVNGATEMKRWAEKRGHQLIPFYTGEWTSPAALDRRWRTQGIEGLFFESHNFNPDPVGVALRTQWDLSAYALVKLGNGLPELAINAVRAIVFEQVIHTYEQVLAAGYRRVLFIFHPSTSPADDQMRRGAALVAKAGADERKVDVELWEVKPTPPMWEPLTGEPLQTELHARIRAFKPDVIIGFGNLIHSWLTYSGYFIPRDFAYASPVTKPGDEGIAGTLDDICGAEFDVGLQLMEELLSRGQRGRPESIRESIVSVRWKPDSSLPPRVYQEQSPLGPSQAP